MENFVQNDMSSPKLLTTLNTRRNLVDPEAQISINRNIYDINVLIVDDQVFNISILEEILLDKF